jgi:peptidoglycan/LPS O-acetylase OafA/YrhL
VAFERHWKLKGGPDRSLLEIALGAGSGLIGKMGFFRFFLAISVVLFHFGNANWVVGRFAVFCFYFVSGFLICRVIDTQYSGGVGRLAAFYCNRTLRLFPLYIVITALTFIIFKLHGSTTFSLAAAVKIPYLDEQIVTVIPAQLKEWIPLPSLIYSPSSPLPVVRGTTRAIPQGWSVAVEMSFYLISPILVVLAKRGVWPLIVLALVATYTFMYTALRLPPLDVNPFVYMNAVTSAFMFLWGSVVYVILRNTKIRVPFWVSAAVVSLGAYYIYAWSASIALGNTMAFTHAFIANMLLGIPVSALVCLTIVPEGLRRWEARLGDLSYGIYLNHVLMAGLLMWIAEAYRPWLFGTFNQPAFGLSVVVGSVLLATLTFNLVERPVEVLRRKIKTEGSS